MDLQSVWNSAWPAVAGGIGVYVGIRADLAAMKIRIDHFEKEQERHYNRLNEIERRSGFDRRANSSNSGGE